MSFLSRKLLVGQLPRIIGILIGLAEQRWPSRGGRQFFRGLRYGYALVGMFLAFQAIRKRFDR
jgi:hypothetical protein